jgi:hypothetical protein
MSKHWIAHALESLKLSLEPVPHEMNELDWKVALSENRIAWWSILSLLLTILTASFSIL